MSVPQPGSDVNMPFWRGDRSPREIRYEAVTTVPMIIASFLFLASMSILILDDLNYFAPFDKFLLGVLFVVWIAFWIDYFIRLKLSTNRRSFFRHSIIDLISLVMPVARPFLLLVYLSRLPFFSGRESKNIRARVVVYLVSFAVLYAYVISLLVYAAERNAPGATITSFGNSIWWAVVTITTVGYGDVVPITVVGRIYAGFLMLGSLLIVAAITGLVVSWFGEMVSQAQIRQKARSEKNHDK